ncbi:MAG TPA: hypothetical protein ACFYED_00245 [Candidatus Tripitaka californicus]|uniref:hypothetical protein n=1 Tax=Candidatus Tripitaka californicus TaxID=3367616 RepID=UPI0040251F23
MVLQAPTLLTKRDRHLLYKDCAQHSTALLKTLRYAPPSATGYRYLLTWKADCPKCCAQVEKWVREWGSKSISLYVSLGTQAGFLSLYSQESNVPLRETPVPSGWMGGDMNGWE